MTLSQTLFGLTNSPKLILLKPNLEISKGLSLFFQIVFESSEAAHHLSTDELQSTIYFSLQALESHLTSSKAGSQVKAV